MAEIYSWYDVAPHHHNYKHRNKILSWSGTDSEEAFIKHCNTPDDFEKLKQLNWLEPGVITYEYNNHGFRTEPFDNRPAGLALGCSFTEGVGVKLEQTWPAVLSKLCNFHIWNLGVGGVSLDTVFRLLDNYLPLLNAKFVCILPPPASRFEYCDNDGLFIQVTPNSHHHHDFDKVWLTQPHNAIINVRKNLLAIQQVCMVANIPLFFVNIPPGKYCDRLARDLRHPGPDAQYILAENFYNQIIDSNINFID
jgi:hypothetical protein